MILNSLVVCGFTFYFCFENFFYLWPFIFIYSVIVLLYFMLNKHVTFLFQYYENIKHTYTNYTNCIQYNLNDKECPVCLELFNSGYIYSCDHFICETCFKNWIQINHDIKCVTCRTGIIDIINNI